MSRKRIPNHPIITIQSLSTGEAEPMVDDFTGEVILSATASPPVPLSAQAIIDAANRLKHLENRLLLEAAGIIKPEIIPQTPNTPRRKT